MEIQFKNNKIEKICSDVKTRLRRCGVSQAKVLEKRLAVLIAAESLQDLGPMKKKPERLHQLEGDMAGKLSVDLDGPYRLIFSIDHDPVPLNTDNSLDLRNITKIVIEDIEDTHG